MAENLPGLNYDSKLAIDDLKFEAEAVETAILDRTAIVFGDGALSTPRYGIIDSVNPRDLVPTDTSRPLAVFPAEANPLHISIAAGRAVTPNGSLVENETLLEDVTLVRTAANDIIVVFIENEIIDSDPNRITRYNTLEQVRRIQNTDKIRSALLTDYSNPVLFPPSRIANIVVLTVIRVVETVTGLELQPDYSNSAYSFNRPWYSPADVEHRASLGSGVTTEHNPHGTSFNDLTSGSLTLYDQLLPYGLIQSRDISTKGVPGTLCAEAIETSRVLVDVSGSITAEARFGGAGTSYIVLARYPVWVHTFYTNSHKGRTVAFEWIPGTRILVLPDPETLDSDGTVLYNEVFALEPPAAVLSNNLTFGQPNSGVEIIYAGGLSLTSLTSNVIDFDGSGPVPRDYKIYLKGDGTLLRTPELIQSTILLDDIGSTLHPISYQFFGPAQLSIGLADANVIASMAVTIRFYGKDADGNTITEDMAFSGTSWVSVTIPGVETPAQSLRTSQVFYSLQNIQVISRVDDGPNSKVVLLAELETGTTTDLEKLVEVATLSWDGLAINQLLDIRKVVRTIPEIVNKYQSSGEITGTGGTLAGNLLVAEDFFQPHYLDIIKGSQAATFAGFFIFIDDFSLIQAGDQIQFPSGSIVTAITAGVPNRTIGQFKSSVSNTATRDDLILTINDVVFNSGVAAAPDGSQPNQANCTMIIAGAQGNGPVTKPVAANPTAISISAGGAIGGIDSFGEIYMPHQKDFIDTIIPSPSTYDVENVRDRYRSRAIPVGNKQRISLYAMGALPPYGNLQLRARVAIGFDPVWLPWEVITGDGTFFTFTKASPITKVQVEWFGRLSGYLLLEDDI